MGDESATVLAATLTWLLKGAVSSTYWSRLLTLRLAPVLKTIFINVPYHILVAGRILMALF